MDNRNESDHTKDLRTGKKHGRGFMKKMKEAWDNIYENSRMTAQTLRDNADSTKAIRYSTL